MKSFGDVLLGFIEVSRYRNQRQFAIAIGMESTYLNRIIKGKVQRPDAETLAKMAKALDRDYDELMELAGYPPMASGGHGGVLPPVEPDAPLDVARIVAFVESHPDRRFRAELAEIKAEIPDDSYVEMCIDTFRAWLSNGNLAVRTARRTLGRSDTGR